MQLVASLLRKFEYKGIEAKDPNIVVQEMKTFIFSFKDTESSLGNENESNGMNTFVQYVTNLRERFQNREATQSPDCTMSKRLKTEFFENEFETVEGFKIHLKSILVHDLLHRLELEKRDENEKQKRSKELNNDIENTFAYLECLMELANQDIIPEGVSFQSFVNEKEEENKHKMTKNYYARLLFATIQIKIEDYRKLLLEIQERTFKDCKIFFLNRMGIFEENVGKKFIQASDIGTDDDLVTALQSFEDCIDVNVCKTYWGGDYSTWQIQRNHFEIEAVSIKLQLFMK